MWFILSFISLTNLYHSWLSFVGLFHPRPSVSVMPPRRRSESFLLVVTYARIPTAQSCPLSLLPLLPVSLVTVAPVDLASLVSAPTTSNEYLLESPTPYYWNRCARETLSSGVMARRHSHQSRRCCWCRRFALDRLFPVKEATVYSPFPIRFFRQSHITLHSTRATVLFFQLCVRHGCSSSVLA